MTQKSWTFIFLFDFTFLQWHKKVELSFFSLISPFYNDTKKLNFHFPLWFHLFTMTQKSWPFIFLFDFTFLQWHKQIELSFSSLISPFYNDTKKVELSFSSLISPFYNDKKSWPFIFLFDFTFLQWHKKVDLSFSSLISPFYKDTTKLAFQFPLWFHLFTMTQKSWPFIFLVDFTFLQWHKKVELSFSSLISPFYNDTKKLNFHFPLWFHLFTMTQKSWPFIFLFDFTFIQWHKKVGLSFSSLISPLYNDTKKLTFHYPLWFHLYTMTQKSWPFIFLCDFTFLQWHKKVGLSVSSLISPFYNDTKKLAFHFPLWFHLFTMTQKVELSFSSLISPFYNDTKKLAFHFPLSFHLFTMTQKSWPFIFLFDFTFIQWHKKVELSFSSLISPLYNDTKKLNFHFPPWFHLYTMTQKSWPFIFLFDFTFIQWHKKVDLSCSSLISPLYSDTKSWTFIFLFDFTFLQWHKKLNFHFPLWFHLFTMTQKSWPFIFLFDFTFLQWHKKVDLSFSSLISPFYNDTKKLNFHFPLRFHLFTMTQKSWTFIFLFDFTFLQWHKKLNFQFPLWFHLFTMTQKSWPFIFLFDFTFLQWHKKVDFHFPLWFHLFTMTQKSWPFIFLFEFTFIQWHKKVDLSFSSLISPFYNDTKKLNFHFPLWFHLFTMTQKSWTFIFLFDFAFLQRHKKVELSFSSLISPFYNDTKKLDFHFPLWFHLYTMTKKVDLSFSSLISPFYNDTKKLNFHFPLWFHLFTMKQKSWPFIFLSDFTFIQWHIKVGLSFSSLISPLYNDTKKLNFHFPLWFHLFTMTQKSWTFIFLFDFTFLQWHKKVGLSFSSLISPFYNDTKKLTFHFPLWFHLFTMSQKSWTFIFLFDFTFLQWHKKVELSVSSLNFTFIQWHKKVELSFSSLSSPFYNDTKKLNFHFPLWFHLFTMTQKSWTFIFLFDFTFLQWHKKVELSFSSLISPFYNDTKKLNFHFPLWFHLFTMTQKSWTFIFLFDFTFLQWHKKFDFSFSSLISPFYNDTTNLNFHFPLWFHLFTMTQKSWPFIFLFDFTFLQWHKKVGLSFSSLISPFYNDTKKLNFHFPLWFHLFTMTQKSWPFIFLFDFTFLQWHKKVGLSFSSLISPFYNDTKKLTFHFPLWFHLFTMTQKSWPFIFLFDFTFLQWHKKVDLSFSSLISPLYNDTKKLTFHFPLWFRLYTMTKKVDLSFSSLISPLYNDTKSWTFIFLFDFTFLQWHKKVGLSFSSLISPFYNDTKKLNFHFPLWFHLFTMT